MISVGKQIQELRKKNNLSQSQLAEQIGVSLTQLQRYENKGVQPPADILNKLAGALDTSVDFLINGDSTEKAQSTLKDTELLNQFKEVDQLPEDDKKTILKVIAAYIRDSKTRKAYSL
ncbi:MAG TPA: transcriptional regulator [Marinilabiliales bacterium]|jgi:transcriptional regulator with XRE-family HTH domain|nr:transcriptional regulator [Marinilabiliales bacterium]